MNYKQAIIMSYNYKQIVIGCAEKLKDESYCIDYFIENAQMVERDYFKKANNFFKDCNSVIIEYKEVISSQLREEVSELTAHLEVYQQTLDRGIEHDENGKPIQEHIEYLQDEIEGIKEYAKCNYKCRVIIPTGEVTHSYHPNAKELYIEDIEVLERCMAIAERELLSDVQKPKEKQSIELPDDLLTKLEQQGFIEKEPLRWLKSKSLLAYFVDVANDKLKLKKGQKRTIKPFEEMFNVSGLTNCINEYRNKTGQLPIGYEDIDKLFE